MAPTAIMIITVMLPTFVHGEPVHYEDGQSPIFIDSDVPSAGATLHPDVDIVRLGLGPQGEVLELTFYLAECQDCVALPPGRILYEYRFHGDWLDNGRVIALIEDGRVILARIYLIYESSAIALFIPSVWDAGARTLKLAVPLALLTGDLEDGFARTEYQPRPAGLNLSGSTTPGLGDRIPDSGYLPNQSPQ